LLVQFRQKLKKLKTQIYMDSDLRYMDHQGKEINYFFK